jgi:hypothetical protein
MAKAGASSSFSGEKKPQRAQGRALKAIELGAHRIAIEYLSIDRLKPDSRNPRQHSTKQIRQIADSIATFGFGSGL